MTNTALSDNHMKVLANLDDLAHEINVRLTKAVDHRLSASLLLAKAKEVCKAQGVPFKSWVTKEIKGIGYIEATRLAKIGGTADPAKALEDSRTKARTGMKTGREAKVANVSNSPSGRGKKAIVARVRDAICALDGLPPPREVADYLRGSDASVVVDDHLMTALQWLGEFTNIWSKQNAQ